MKICPQCGYSKELQSSSPLFEIDAKYKDEQDVIWTAIIGKDGHPYVRSENNKQGCWDMGKGLTKIETPPTE